MQDLAIVSMAGCRDVLMYGYSYIEASLRRRLVHFLFANIPSQYVGAGDSCLPKIPNTKLIFAFFTITLKTLKDKDKVLTEE